MKYSCKHARKPLSGFALIEVLIAVVVLATGLLALTALQGALTRSSADSKARSQVAAYVASEMDRIRTGELVVAKAATSGGTDPISDTARAAGLASLSQTVTSEFFYADAAGNFATTNPNTSKNAWFRRVRLNMSWTDATGGSRSLSMTTDMSPLVLSASKVLVDREPPDPNELRPIVRRQSPLTEGMIPIALGDGQDTAATNPKPELVGKKQDTYVADTRFDVLTYAIGENGFARFNKRIETAFVGCRCQMGLGGFPTGGSSPAINTLLRDRAFRPSYWDGVAYTVPKETAEVKRSPDTSASQSALCDVCCRDHRDPGTDTPKFNPWIAAHDHYDSSGALVAEPGSGTFIEACRVIRTDGIWRVTPDPRVEDIALLATRTYPSDKGSPGSTAAPANNNRATSPLTANVVSTPGVSGSYIDYTYDYLAQMFYNKTNVDRLALQKTRGLNAPDYVPIGVTDSADMDGDGNATEADVRWLHSRGLLTDQLHTDAAKRIDQAIADCKDASSEEKRAQCILPYLPVSTVNVTELAKWGGKQVSETGIDTTGFPEEGVNFAQTILNRFASAIARIGAIGPLDGNAPLLDEQTVMLIPGITKPGAWLKVASPAGTAFGDATRPVRGFARVAGATAFSVRLNGIPGTSEAQLTTRPGVEVGASGTNKCTPNRTNNSNPYACDAESSTGVLLALGDYNRQAVSNSNVKVCNDTQNRKQAVCLKYTLTSGTVDGTLYNSAGLSYSVVSGTGTPSEKSTLVLPTLKDPPVQSEVILQFSENSSDAQAVCHEVTGSFVEWSCN